MSLFRRFAGLRTVHVIVRILNEFVLVRDIRLTRWRIDSGSFKWSWVLEVRKLWPAWICWMSQFPTMIAGGSFLLIWTEFHRVEMNRLLMIIFWSEWSFFRILTLRKFWPQDISLWKQFGLYLAPNASGELEYRFILWSDSPWNTLSGCSSYVLH